MLNGYINLTLGEDISPYTPQDIKIGNKLRRVRSV